jgi:predicted CXXCH cytochrome family protein
LLIFFTKIYIFVILDIKFNRLFIPFKPMKKALSFFLLTLLQFTFSAYAVEPDGSLYEEVLDTSHNIVPRGDTPAATHQVCQVCHTAEEVQGYLEPPTVTPPELAAIFEPPRQTEGLNSKVLWNPAETKISYLPGRSKVMSKEPSTACLSCHDGVIGNDIHGLKQASGKFQDHPVSVPYPRESNGHFVPALPLPNELRYWSIPDQNAKGITLPTGPTSEYFSKLTPPLMAVRTSYGKVNCGSCHNPHSSRISAYLRESPKTLCLVCHIR